MRKKNVGQKHLREIVADAANDLSPRMRDAANYILLNPDQVATRSLRQVAAAANLSAPTFSRLARILGFEDYEALRDVCREALLRHQPSFAERAEILQSGSLSDAADASFVAEQSRSAVNNIVGLAEADLPNALDVAAQWISDADQVVVCGSMISRHLAAYSVYLARLSSAKWRLLDDIGASPGSFLIDLTKKSVVLAIATAPYAHQTVDFAGAARKAGSRVVAITDVPLSPLASNADLAIPVGTDGPNFFPSFAAVLVVLETLIGMTVAKGGKAARDRLAAIEAENRRAGSYDDR